MDREIKFRLWDKAEQYFVPDDRFAVINGRGQGDQLAICITPWLAVQVDEIWYSHQGELMQYTGLKDKNGTEIYEGDIIRKPYLYDEFSGDNATGYWEWRHEIRVATYKNGMFCYDGEDFQSITQYPDTEHLKEHYPLPDNFSAGLEVIGNIYENPELIEQ